MFFLVILLMLISCVSLYIIMRSSDLSFKDFLLIWSRPNNLSYMHIKRIYPFIKYNSTNGKEVLFIVKKVRELENAIIQRHKTIFSVIWDDIFQKLSVINKFKPDYSQEKSNADILNFKREIDLLKKHLWDMIVNIYNTSFINETEGKSLYDDLILTAQKYDEFLKFVERYDTQSQRIFEWLKLDPLLTKD